MTNSTKSPKKANLLDPHAIKHLLDESVTEIVTGKGFPEDFRTSNARLGIGSLIIAVALLAQLYPKKFPENRDLLLICIGLYVVLNGILQVISYTKERDAILFTYPPVVADCSGFIFRMLYQSCTFPKGSFTSTGLVVSSKLPRFSDVYTLTIASADPKSISANKPVKLSKSVTKWFTKDGILVEGLFWKDIEGLIDDYKGDHKNK